jgi:hypothetical protein
VAGAIAVCLAACATASHPATSIARAEAALVEAAEAGAAQQAPIDFSQARQKLIAARSTTDRVEARRLAEKAFVDAQLGLVKTRLAAAEEGARQARAALGYGERSAPIGAGALR